MTSSQPHQKPHRLIKSEDYLIAILFVFLLYFVHLFGAFAGSGRTSAELLYGVEFEDKRFKAFAERLYMVADILIIVLGLIFLLFWGGSSVVQMLLK